MRTLGETMAELVRRAESLGLACWRCSVGGELTYEPEATSTIGLWLNSEPLRRMVIDAAAAWNEERTPAIATPFEGCWLVPIVYEYRRERRGYLVAMALGQAAFDTEEFGRIAASAGLTPGVARAAWAPRATFIAPGVDRVVSALARAKADLDELDEMRRANDGFVRHLTESYEQSALLYRLMVSMDAPDRPERLVRAALRELADTTEFAWVAFRGIEGERLCRDLREPLIVHVGESIDGASVREAVGRFGEGAADSEMILDDLGGFSLSVGPQVVIEPIHRNGQTIAHLLAGSKGGEDPQVSSYDTRLLESVCGYLGAMLESTALYAEQKRTFVGTLRALTSAIDAKDRYTRGHSERVAFMARALARAVGWSVEQAERVHIAGLVHDVGKIGVPGSVLCKPGKLTEEEFALIKQHPRTGYEILKGIPSLEDMLPAVLYHHERPDGRGYPDGLAGDAIPRIAQIMAVADAFDAMSSTRSYRPAMPRERVFEELRRGAGAQFTDDLVEPFLSLDMEPYDRLVAKHHADERGREAA